MKQPVAVRLEQPLESTYEKGSLLFPVIESQSDVKGEVLLFFKPYRIKPLESR